MYITYLIGLNIHTYMHTYIHACIHACIHSYIDTYIHTYIHTYMYGYTYIMHTYTHTYIHTYIERFVLFLSRHFLTVGRKVTLPVRSAYIHTCIPTYIQKHAHTLQLWRPPRASHCKGCNRCFERFGERICACVY